MAAPKFDAHYDVIVVGGGSAGCVVAARLAEADGLSVCLVEAGERNESFRIRAPFAFPWIVGDPALDWGYETEPEPELGGRRIAWPRGRLLGGSGAINGLVFLRGFAGDFDDWARQGAAGWSFSDVLPWFRRLERNAGGSDYRGQDGPLTVSDIAAPAAPPQAFVETCRRLGQPYNSDFNGAEAEGVGFTQINTARGWRVSTADAYLRPETLRKLALVTGATARRVLFDGRKAIGVEVESGGARRRLRARAEVVLCAGAINTPLLLLASGIGPAAGSSAAGIAHVHDLPGVGRNLQDHFLVPLKFRTRGSGSLNRIARNPLLALGAALRWRLGHRGPFAVAGTEAVLFARSHPDAPAADIQFQCANFSNDDFTTGLHRWSGFMSVFYACRPQSRGAVTLGDPAGRTARIRANYLSHPGDLRVTLAAFAIAAQIFATDPIATLITKRISPAIDDWESEAGRDAHVRRHGGTGNHPCGTARMGSAGDPEAVVDPELRLRGIASLRVIDASVMPTIPSSNIHAATIMIAEKGAGLLREALRLRAK